MKRYICFFAATVFFYCKTQSQILNQDASGKSAIVWQGSSINIDIGETLFKISHYGQFKKGKGLFGIDLQGKNASGNASVISGGEFTPSAELSFLIGGRKVTVLDPTIEGQTELQNARARILPLLEDAWEKIVKDKINGCKDDLGQVTQSTTDFKKALNELNTKGWSDISTNIYISIGAIKEEDKCKATLTAEALAAMKAIQAEPHLADYLKVLKQIDSLAKDMQPYMKNNTRTWYLRGGINPMQFKYDKGTSFAAFDDRFFDTLNVGFYIHGGETFQWRKNFLGFNVGYLYTSNFLSLDQTDYEFERVDPTLTPGVLKQKESFTAYTGDFKRLSKITFNFDYLYMVELGQSHYLLPGPYIRHFFSFDKNIEKSNTVLGCGVNYLNGASGKFLGGVYLQTEDLFGNQESSFRKTVQVGLIAKFSLSSTFLMK